MPAPVPQLGIQVLLAAPAAERAGLLRAQRDASATLRALVAEAEESARQDAGRAVDGVRAVCDLAAAVGPLADGGVRARAQRALSHALAVSGDFPAALEAAERASREALAAGATVEAARAHLARMQPLLNLGRAADAAEAGRQAAAELDAAGDLALAARARVNLANVLKALGQSQEALEALDAALAVAGADAPFFVVAQNTRGEALLQLGEFEQARQAFTRALAATDPNAETFPSAMVRSNLADLDARIGRAQAALDGYESARRAFGFLKSESQVLRLIVEEAELFAALGATGEAAEAYRRALPEVESRGMAFGKARALAGVALVESIRNPRGSDIAVEAHERAVEAWRAVGNRPEAARAGLRLAEALAEAGEAARAAGHVERAAAELGEGALDQLAILAARAACAAATGDVEGWRRGLADAELISASLHLSPAAATLAARSARLEREGGNIERGITCARRAVAHVERARMAVNAERLRQSILGSRVDAFEELVLALLARGGKGDAEQALDVVTRAKSRSLIERLLAGADGALAKVGTGADPVQSEERRLLIERLNALYRQMGAGGTPGQRDLTAHVAAKEISQVERALESLDVRAPGLSETHAPPRWNETRQVLAAEDLLLEFFVAQGHVVAFAGTRAGAVRTVWLPLTLEDAALQSRRIQFQVRRSLRGADDAAGQLNGHLRELWDSLLAPFEHELAQAGRAIIAPHSVLHSLPFGAFTPPEGVPLMARMPVVVLPNGAMLTSLVGPGGGGDARGALVVGVADALAPNIEPECRSVASALGVRPLLGQDATIDRVMAGLEGVEVAHIASHGIYLSDAARSSGLKMADGWLTVRQIQSLRQGPRTVVLSGCETGRSRLAPGDEHLGLVRAFVDRGARTVVSTLWAAQDVSACRMMVDYHQSRAINPDGTDAELLRQSQLSLRAHDAGPARWAPYFVTGGLS